MNNTETIRFALSQINLSVGDVSGNTDRILDNIAQAKQRQANIIIFPELAVVGYPPEDLLYRPTLYKQIKYSLQKICQASDGIDIVIGYPEQKDGVLYNACGILRQGEIISHYYKQHLPNYSVFDEKRYFVGGYGETVFDLLGKRVALSICEDVWKAEICRQAKQAGAELMININASPYHVGKLETRLDMLKTRAIESDMSIIYLNLLGGQDELVFDGGSIVVSNQGEVIFRAPQFQEGIYLIDYDTQRGSFSPAEQYRTENLVQEESIYRALVLGIQDYVGKNRFSGVVIGLSGGIDSALTLCLAADALGAENVEVLLMPSKYTSAMSNEDAEMQAKNLGVRYTVISIEEAVIAFNKSLQPIFSGLPADLTEENIQARCRGILLMAVSNKTHKLVLATSNKSELSVGYATLYGDMVGGFAPLKDIPKMMVFKLAEWRNQLSAQTIIPQRVINRPPSAELRENQIDEDSLPPYPILDMILERYIELDQNPTEIMRANFDEKTVRQVVRLVDSSEHKRRQAMPGVRISQRAFGRERRYPITSAYRE